MVGVSSRGYLRTLHGLLELGTFGQLTDAELLERFTRRENAEVVFEALVARHGPAVLQVCRSVLGQTHDAEDAFQATFLVLARRAESIARPQELAAWLRGVVRRIALKAKIADHRRRLHEQRFAEKSGAARIDAQSSQEPLHEELDRLPDSLRAPVVLCYLEEMTYQAAAQRLGLTEGTIRGRLAKARDLLRSRLARRGEIPPAARHGRSLDFDSTRDAVPPPLIAGTTRAAIQIAKGALGSIGVSSAVIELTEGALPMMFITRLKIAATVLAALGLTTAGAAALATQAANIASQERPSTGVVSAPASVTSNNASERIWNNAKGGDRTVAARKRSTLESRLEIPMARADCLESLLTFDRSTDADGRNRAGRALQACRSSSEQRSRPPAPRRLVEAQYQDAVRNEIDAVYKAFVDVEAMQERLHQASVSVAKWDRLLKATQTLVENAYQPAADLDRIRTRCDAARSTRDDAKSSLRRAKTALGSLLNLPSSERERLEVASRLKRLRSARTSRRR